MRFAEGPRGRDRSASQGAWRVSHVSARSAASQICWSSPYRPTFGMSLSVSHGSSQRAAAAAQSGHAEWECQASAQFIPLRMATAGMRVLVLAALAVGLLAAAVSGARDAMKVARGLVPSEGGAPGGAGAAGQQRKGARILAAETFAHNAPLPGYLDHIPRRQALATCTQRCSLSSLLWFFALLFLPSHCPSLLSLPLILLLSLPFPGDFILNLRAHDGDDPLAVPGAVRPAQRNLTPAPSLPFSPSPPSPVLLPACGRTTVTIRSQYLGPYDLHNDIYNMTFYNGCAYNVTSPLRVWQCFNFGNVWEGILDNPDPNPSQYQQGEIFVQTTPGYCEMRMNRGASGTLQMLPGETVNIVYAYLWDFRPCVQELRFGNGNSYSMTNTTECQLAQTI
ncbi:unnamed protein product [Closterium sp. Naga37s-1]|nr:unnamed protein product [Closterium sp. Naga37s-1]